jgi:hypothetical protein
LIKSSVIAVKILLLKRPKALITSGFSVLLYSAEEVAVHPVLDSNL